MGTETRSLHRKLAQVLIEVGRIPKAGQAPKEMGGYKFVQVGDAADAIRAALAEKLLTMHPTKVTVVGQVDRPTRNGGNMTTVDLIVDWTITDAESGESLVIQSFGAGADGGDKYSGKAMTSAMKYAFLAGFLLSTGDDTERDKSPEQMNRRLSEPSPPPVEQPPGDLDKRTGSEVEEMMGRVERRGVIRKGTAEGYKLEPRVGPDGHVIGFRLEIDGDKNIPQCVVSGAIGEQLFLAYPDPSKLVATTAKVAGILYNVRRSDGPGSWYRLHVDRFENAEWILPADPADAPVPPPPDDVPLAGEKVA